MRIDKAPSDSVLRIPFRQKSMRTYPFGVCTALPVRALYLNRVSRKEKLSHMSISSLASFPSANMSMNIPARIPSREPRPVCTSPESSQQSSPDRSPACVNPVKSEKKSSSSAQEKAPDNGATDRPTDLCWTPHVDSPCCADHQSLIGNKSSAVHVQDGVSGIAHGLLAQLQGRVCCEQAVSTVLRYFELVLQTNRKLDEIDRTTIHLRDEQYGKTKSNIQMLTELCREASSAYLADENWIAYDTDNNQEIRYSDDTAAFGNMLSASTCNTNPDSQGLEPLSRQLAHDGGFFTDTPNTTPRCSCDDEPKDATCSAHTTELLGGNNSSDEADSMEARVSLSLAMRSLRDELLEAGETVDADMS
ncbi:hypothetical protein B0T26DRAFT_246463 [Lasiosphaeria miniovina]|uniref:Uncharacterized protein n=1 Tax=Lasiosphaeria miniovina TaxID=1954250 RepID=A0AA40E111_9PEZI|nr:uncharacterized protein B0T26DRAFT_246463 [Lasiosphaeria miniovina]KAK0723050.1 hypothetical protein B0T26DRAFT_246463 [Lasiosphaeria miniovina]